MFISTIGFIRLPDVYNRAHALSKSSTLGVLFVLLGTFLFFVFMENYFSIKLFLGIFFVFLTTPVSAHVICRSAYRAGVPLAPISVQDDLRDFLFVTDDGNNNSETNSETNSKTNYVHDRDSKIGDDFDDD